MRRFFTAIAVLTLVAIAPGIAAPGLGTAKQARAMLERAVTALKADPVAAVASFNRADGGFRDRDLYVACFDARSGIVKAHIDPQQLGVDVRTMKQPNGKAFGLTIFNAAKAGSIATVDYEFPRPGDKVHSAKRSYVTRVGNNACLVGYYK
jgi:hypothetical protein